MKYLLSLFCMILSVGIVRAQGTDSLVVKNNILFFKDPRVDVLQKMYSRNNETKKSYIRVQVFQASSRDKIFESKAQFSARFPGIATFVTYAPPNFRLRVGEFATQQEAFKFMQQTKPYFPASFVIEEKGGDDDKQKSKK